MRAYARRRLPHDRVDDCVQETWLASIAPDAFEGRCRFDTFVMAILRRRIADVYRARARGPALLEHDPASSETSPDERVDAHLVLLRIAPTFARLPERQRASLEVEVFRCDGDPASLRSASVGNRRVLLHRARTSLRRAVEERRAGEGRRQ